MGSFTHLLAGHDTVECAYYLHDLSAGEGVGLEALHAGKEAVRRKRRPKLVVLGGDEFYLFGHGTSSGYPFLLENANYSIGYGEFNMPSFFVTLRSEALWREGVVALHERFLTWAQSLGFQPARTETLSRVDFTFDYQIPEPDFDADSVVSLSAKDGTFRKDRREQTSSMERAAPRCCAFTTRSWRSTRAVASSGSASCGVFSSTSGALSGRCAKRCSSDSLSGRCKTLDQQRDLLTYLAEEHDTLRLKTPDGNRSRWPLHPVWIDLRERIRAFNREGVHWSFDPGTAVTFPRYLAMPRGESVMWLFHCHPERSHRRRDDGPSSSLAEEIRSQ